MVVIIHVYYIIYFLYIDLIICTITPYDHIYNALFQRLHHTTLFQIECVSSPHAYSSCVEYGQYLFHKRFGYPACSTHPLWNSDKPSDCEMSSASLLSCLKSKKWSTTYLASETRWMESPPFSSLSTRSLNRLIAMPA